MAGGKGNAAITALLQAIFQNTAWGTLLAVGSATQLYVSLHTADPGAAGSQTTSEATYSGYARVAVNRNSGGFTVSGETITFAANVTFPIGLSGAIPVDTITYVGIGTASSGAGQILYRAALSPSVLTGSGVTPVISSGGTGIVES